MIEEKQIKEAAKKHSDNASGDYIAATEAEEGFKEGAHWAIKEFLKDLWHPKDEEPQVGRMILVRFSDEHCLGFKWTQYFYWEEYCKLEKRIAGWLYIDDLLELKGGKK